MAERNIALVDAFLALQIIGAILFILTILSAILLRGSKRHPIFFSFCLSWIVYGISYSLLLLSGQQFKRPNHTVCMVQAALVYASPFLESSTSLGLVIHLLLNVLSALSISPRKKDHPTFMSVLITLPWLIWTAVFIGVLAYALLHQQDVVMSPNFTYCVIVGSPIPKITAVTTTLGVMAIIVVECMIGFLLYRNRTFVTIFSQSMAMAIRILIFTILGLGALSCGIIFTVTRTRGVQFDLILAILPPAAALTFGTQSDLLLGWIWCRFSSAQRHPHTAVITLTAVDFNNASHDRESFLSPESSPRPSTPRTPNPPRALPSEVTSFLHF